jgi:GT2 family glycosyltransferase
MAAIASPPFVSVIVVNWNGRHHLHTCLTALLAQDYSHFEIILVDNGSTDGSATYVRERFPQVRLIPLQKNYGFSGGNNVGILASQAVYVALLNNDTRAERGWLSALVAAAEGDPGVGMCAAKMLFMDRPELINTTGICLDRLGIAWDRLGGAPDRPPAPPTPIFGPSGGAVLYRRAMLDEIGLFDEAFFAYLEDVDLAWRAQLAGWGCVAVETAVVYHHHSATAGEGSPFKSKLLGRNKVWLILKNYPLPALLRYAPLILAYDAGAVLVALLMRRDLNPLLGRLQALRGLAGILRQRRAIQAGKKRSADEIMGLLAPVEAPQRVWRRYRHL